MVNSIKLKDILKVSHVIVAVGHIGKMQNKYRKIGNADAISQIQTINNVSIPNCRS